MASNHSLKTEQEKSWTRRSHKRGKKYRGFYTLKENMPRWSYPSYTKLTLVHSPGLSPVMSGIHSGEQNKITKGASHAVVHVIQ